MLAALSHVLPSHHVLSEQAALALLHQLLRIGRDSLAPDINGQGSQCMGCGIATHLCMEGEHCTLRCTLLQTCVTYQKQLWPTATRQHTRAVICRFENVSRHQAEHAGLYSYADPATGQRRLAKFSGRYGNNVHAVWASVGLAPALFDVVDLDFNTLLITMELLPQAWRVLSDVSDSELLEAKPYVLQALRRAQNVQICMGALGAHGDMRLPNVAVLFETNQWHVRFLDFDWAGLQGRICMLHS